MGGSKVLPTHGKLRPLAVGAAIGLFGRHEVLGLGWAGVPIVGDAVCVAVWAAIARVNATTIFSTEETLVHARGDPVAVAIIATSSSAAASAGREMRPLAFGAAIRWFWWQAVFRFGRTGVATIWDTVRVAIRASVVRMGSAAVLLASATLVDAVRDTVAVAIALPSAAATSAARRLPADGGR